ncbi:hypothetical protein F4823DRAFT_253554 [Ustulina deusta]|nr:hypothetical protein F4823DRAFT_253554 [Ustulina deusta]
MGSFLQIMSREREKDEYTRPRRPDGREATADFARGGTRSKADRDRGSDGIIVSRSAPSRHKYISPGYNSQFARLDDFNRHQDRHTAEESMRRRFSQKGSLVSQSSPVNNIKQLPSSNYISWHLLLVQKVDLPYNLYEGFTARTNNSQKGLEMGVSRGFRLGHSR